MPTTFLDTRSKQKRTRFGRMVMRTYREDVPAMVSIKEMPLCQRPRERLCEVGGQALSDLELLTIMIGSGTALKPAGEMAGEVLALLDRCDVSKELTVSDVQALPGMGKAKAAVICAALELGRRRLPQRRKQIVFPHDVYPFIQHFGNRNQEHFLCISLNGAHEVLSVHVVSIGLVNFTLVHPREVFADPLRERATAIIVAHNHPSGNLMPSQDDINVTIRLKKAGDLLGIKLLDHLIFSEDSYRSMLEENELST